jgi:predicted transcriptional regulator
VRKDEDVKEAARMMEENMVRRLPVVDENDDVCGMFAQADIALNGSDKLTAEVVQSIPQPNPEASRV